MHAYAITCASLANVYAKGEDCLHLIPDNVFREIYDYVNREFNNLPCPVSFTEREVDCHGMAEAWEKDGLLLISTMYNDSRLLPGELNLKFRAIHDYIHLTKDYGCDYIGEYNTFLEQCKGLSSYACRVLYSEIVLQAAYCIHFGNFASFQKIVL